MEITKNQAKRMLYKNFDDHITRKHGIVIEGWPLKTFENPSSVGSQLELKVLLNSWKSGATRFHKMSAAEHMAWVEARAEPPNPLTDGRRAPAPPPQQTGQGSSLAPTTITANAVEVPFIQFEPPAAVSTSTVTTLSNPARAPKKPRKERSDKGKPRKKLQIPGVTTFSAMNL